MSTAKDVIKLAKEQKTVAVDFKFLDFLGTWQHFTTPMSELEEDVFESGLGFDGSSIRGWQPINASDMLVVPDPSTAVMDPFTAYPTLSLICDIADPITKEDYSRDPRAVARKAEGYLKSTGIGDTVYFGPEPEFFIFDDVRFEQNEHEAYYHVDSTEGRWNTGRDEAPNLAYKPRYKEGYFPVAPTDSMMDIRQEMVVAMEKVGLHVEKQHHEVATAGQAEIDLRFLSLVNMGDALMWYKYCVKNVARRHGKTATFMPKPIFGDNGSGMHVHQSDLEGRQASVRWRRLRRLQRTRHALHRGHPETWPARSAPSRIRRPTATVGWCRGSRRRSTWRTRRGIVRRHAVSRCIRPHRRPSVSKSGSRMPHAMATSLSQRC